MVCERLRSAVTVCHRKEAVYIELLIQHAIGSIVMRFILDDASVER